MNRKKIASRIIASILIIIGLLMGVTWKSKGICIGDKVFLALGISPWSDGTNGIHYPAIIGIFVNLIGIGILNVTMSKKYRFLFWTIIGFLFIIVSLSFVYV